MIHGCGVARQGYWPCWLIPVSLWSMWTASLAPLLSDCQCLPNICGQNSRSEILFIHSVTTNSSQLCRTSVSSRTPSRWQPGTFQWLANINSHHKYMATWIDCSWNVLILRFVSSRTLMCVFHFWERPPCFSLLERHPLKENHHLLLHQVS